MQVLSRFPLNHEEIVLRRQIFSISQTRLEEGIANVSYLIDTKKVTIEWFILAVATSTAIYNCINLMRNLTIIF